MSAARMGMRGREGEGRGAKGRQRRLAHGCRAVRRHVRGSTKRCWPIPLRWRAVRAHLRTSPEQGQLGSLALAHLEERYAPYTLLGGSLGPGGPGGGRLLSASTGVAFANEAAAMTATRATTARARPLRSVRVMLGAIGVR